MSEERVAQLVRSVADGVSVGAAPVDAVVRQAQRGARHRRIAVAGAVAISAAVVIVAGGLLATVGVQPVPDPAGVARVDNPLPVPWWGDGTLHLAHVTIPVASVTDIVAIGDTVAYGTEDGEVILVQADGERTTVGHKAHEAAMAGGTEEGWLAWVDPQDRAPQMVVYDVTAGTEVVRVDLPYRGPRWERLDAGSHPIAIDGGRVYYATQDGDWSWAQGNDEPRRESPADVDLLDVRAGHRIAHSWSPETGWAENLMLTRPVFDDIRLYRGDRGRYSPDAAYLAVTTDDTTDLFRNGSHDPLRMDLPGGMSGWEVEVVFADATTVVVTTGGSRLPEPSRSAMNNLLPQIPRYDTWDLSTCDLDTGACTTLENATTHATPLLPS